MRHFLNDIEITPRNINEIGVKSNFSGRPDELELTVDSVVLPREALTMVHQWVANYGIFQGIPYRTEMATGISLEYFVDLTEEPVFSDFEIEVKIKKRGGKDHFFERANGTSFELMNKKGVTFNTFDVPYLIIKDNAVELGISLGISLYIMTKELIQAIKDLATAVSDLIQAVTPNATIPPLPPLGAILALVVKVVAQIVYTAAILVAVIKLAQQLFELIFPKIRYYKACKAKDLISKGCQHLGFTFESTLLDNLSGLTILPTPLVKDKKSIFDYIQNDLNFSFTKGYPTAQDTTPTLGSLIDAMEVMFNAKTRVYNGQVRLERRDYWQNITTNQILPALAIQGERVDEYRLNTADIWKRYYIHYQVDYADTHTMDFFDPTDAEYSCEPVTVVNPDLVSIKGLNDVNIPFALGVRKSKLNFIEKLARAFFEVVDEVTSVFGGGTNFVSIIDNRIGVLQISSQYYTTTKILYTIGGKQPENYATIMRASSLWTNYHYINQIQLNDFLIKNKVRAEITNQQFVDLLGNNFAEINGEMCELLEIEFFDEEFNAEISFKQPFNYADGKVSTLVING